MGEQRIYQLLPVGFPPCQSGVWKKQTQCQEIAAGTDLNWLTPPAGTAACYNGPGLGNAPTGDWFFIEVNRHINPGNFYQSQRAVGMTGSAANRTWTRSQQSGSSGSGWSAWKEGGGGVVAGGGVKQIWKALAGQTISCSTNSGSEIFSATVDGNGNYYTQVYDTGYMTGTGWVYGPQATLGVFGSGGGLRTGRTDIGGIIGVSDTTDSDGIRYYATCAAVWS